MVYADGATPRRLPTWWCYVVLSQCALGRLLKSFGQGNTLFLSTPGLRSDTGLSRSALSSLFTVACFAAAALQPYFGKLQDRFGGRISIPAALLGLSVALLLLSSAQGPVLVFVSIVGLRAIGLGALDTFSSATARRALLY